MEGRGELARAQGRIVRPALLDQQSAGPTVTRVNSPCLPLAPNKRREQHLKTRANDLLDYQDHQIKIPQSTVGYARNGE